MRVLVAGVAFVLCTTTGLAQQPSRWTVSVGPEWTRTIANTHLWGARLRAEYDLTRPSSVFGLRLEGGARWGPTQSYFYESGPRSQGGVVEQELSEFLKANRMAGVIVVRPQPVTRRVAISS